MTSPGRKQESFFKHHKKAHGGSVNLGKRKSTRPLDSKMPVHVVLKSNKAKGALALVRFDVEIDKILVKMAEKFQISIYEKNINYTHIHLLIRGKNRQNLQNFFRTIAGLIARLVTGAEKGKAFGKFWSYLLYTRVLGSWKKDFANVRTYIVQNTNEVLGLVPYKTRSQKKTNTS